MGRKPEEVPFGRAGGSTDVVSEGSVWAGAFPDVLARDGELAALGDAIDGARTGGSAVVLRGEPGIGKTTLWEVARRMAEGAGHPVLWCRPAEAEAKLPYAALGDLLGEVGRDLDALPPPQRHALEVALLHVESMSSATEQRAVSVGVVQLLRWLARERLLTIAVDDSQWLDPPSRRVLEFAARRLEEIPGLMLLGIRGGPDDALPLSLDRALPRHRLTVIDLEALPMSAIDRLLRRRLSMAFPHPTLRRLVRISKGNPFFSLEIGRAMLRRGVMSPGDPVPIPGQLRQLVAARLGRLPDDERQVLLSIAAASSPTTDVIGQMVGEDAAALLTTLRDRDIIALELGRVTFTHPLLASSIYVEADPADRRAVHARLAEILTDQVERARHLALATEVPDDRAAREIENAATIAAGRAAPEIAAELAEHAIRLSDPSRPDDRWRRQMLAGEYHYLAGDRDRARELLSPVAAETQPGPTRARSAHALALIRIDEEGLEEGIEALRLAAGFADGDPWLRAMIETELATVLFQAGQMRSSERHARRSVDRARRVGDDGLLQYARTIAGWAAFVLGEGRTPDLVDLDRAQGGNRISAHLSPTYAPFDGDFMLAAMLKWSGHFAVARERFEDLRHRARERLGDASLSSILFQLSELECWAGNWDRADAYMRECEEATSRAGQRSTERVLALRASMAAHRGSLAEARTDAVRALEVTQARSNIPTAIRIFALLGFVELSTGDAVSACRHYERAWAMAEEAGYGEPGIFRFQADAIEATVSSGDIERAKELVDRVRSKGTRLGRTWALVAADRGSGLIAAAERDLGRAERALITAVDRHQALEMPFELARTLLVLGGVRRRRTQKRAARDTLQQALGIFEGLGATAWGDRTRTEIGRIGGRPPASSELSATEAEVARLAGDGLTNREIAEILFMSARTVERHLAHVFPKLGIRSRRELVRRSRGTQADPDAPAPRPT